MNVESVSLLNAKKVVSGTTKKTLISFLIFSFAFFPYGPNIL